MSKRLDENIGAVEYDGLIVNNVPVADVVTVKLATGDGILKRGTVVTGAAGAALAPASAALSATNGTYILTDDTDTGIFHGAAVVATAYRTGHFARNKLHTDGSYTLTAADEEILRNAGILLSDAIEY